MNRSPDEPLLVRRPAPPSRLAPLLALALCWSGAAWPVELPRFDCVITPFKMADVASPVPGVLEVVHLDRSDRVEQGQVVAALDSGVERASLELSRVRATMNSEVHLGKINLAFAEREKARLDSLYTKKVASFHDKDRAERDAALSQWKLRQARDVKKLRQLELHKAEEVLRQKTVRSPLSGVVLERYKSAGEYVEDQPILRLAQLDPLNVEAIVPMEFFGKIQVGMVGEVVPETILKRPHEASVKVVDWMGNAASGTFGVRLELPNPDYRLPAGQKCVVRFLPGSAPSPAVVQQNSMPAETGSTHPDEDVEAPAPALAARGEAQQRPGVEFPPETVEPSGLAEPEPMAGEAGVHTEAVVPEPDPDTALEMPVETEAEPEHALAGLSPSGGHRCHAIGPLQSADLADQLSVLLDDNGFRVSRRETSEQVQAGFSVETPDRDNRQAVRELAAQLSEQGIRDMQIMRRKGRGWRISLGYYTKRKLAELRHEKFSSLGVETVMTEHTKSRASWWLDLIPASGEMSDQALREIIDGIVVGLRPEPIDCPAVLTAQR